MAAMFPRIRAVVDGDLCIACGACIPACPVSNIRKRYDERRGAQEIEIVSSVICIGCSQICDSVCPSIEVDFQLQRTLTQGASNSAEIPARDDGMRSVHLGWSPDFQKDSLSSSGGVVRALLYHSINRGTPVLCLAHKAGDSRLAPSLLTSTDDLVNVPGSIYHSTSFVGAIDLLRESSEPVLLVAIPCQLSGVLQYIARCEPQLKEKIALVCGIVCGWMYSTHSINAFARFNDINNPMVDRTVYRGGDRIGTLQIKTTDGVYRFLRRNHRNYRDAVNYHCCFSTDLNRLRCRVCQDHLNQSADIIAGDAWLSRLTDEKVSIIGVRSRKGESALYDLEAERQVILHAASFDDILESQSHDLIYGYTARMISKVLSDKGYVVPNFQFRADNANQTCHALDKVKVNWEIFRRYLARHHYLIYRALYAIRRPRLALYYMRRYLSRF